MTQIRDGSFALAGRSWAEAPDLGGWWGLWIAGLIVSRVGGVVGDDLGMAAGLALEAVSLACLAGSAVFLRGLVRQITEVHDVGLQLRVFGDKTAPSPAVALPA